MYKSKNYQRAICRFYLRGGCKFGRNCRFNHPETSIECLLIRHAQSQFNFLLNNSENPFHSEQAKQEYQINPKYIDCKVTKNGIRQIRKMQIPESAKENDHVIVDAIFVSPLKRALYTTQQMLRFHQIKYLQVIVIPSLTEVLSKICDFSDCMENKMEKFTKFNFSAFQKWKGRKDIEMWQDQLVDSHLVGMINSAQSNGSRYIQILETIFPEPLQSRNRCFKRALSALGEIKQICIEKGFKRIMIVSHNRILKYMDGKQRNGKAESFDNCQVRKIFL